MAEPVFKPSLELNGAYRDELLEDGVMPAALICIKACGTPYIYGYGRAGMAGLPDFDLAEFRADEGPKAYLRYRLGKKFNLKIAKVAMQILPYEATTPYLEDNGNRYHPEAHYRAYFPVIMETSQTPSRLRKVRPEAMLEGMTPMLDGDVREHFIGMHQEMMKRFVLPENIEE